MTGYRKRTSAARAQEGFTLVVIAALFIAFATIAAVIIERSTATQLITRRDAAKQQLQRLNIALIEYSVYNASGSTLMYPCPAAVNVLTGSTTFGTSVNNGAVPPVDDCSTVAHAAQGITLAGVGPDVVKGMVPVQALAPYGINLNDAFDPWNNRIMYAVNRQLTTGGTRTTTNNPTITNFNTGFVVMKPDFVLLSYGRDGVGAYRRGATSIAIPCSGAGPTGSNCGAFATYFDGPTFTASKATPTTYFDDILSYHNQ